MNYQDDRVFNVFFQESCILVLWKKSSLSIGRVKSVGEKKDFLYKNLAFKMVKKKMGFEINYFSLNFR